MPVAMRVLQGFAVGGEYGGAATMSPNIQPKQRALTG
jgi:hypothetical protein